MSTTSIESQIAAALCFDIRQGQSRIWVYSVVVDDAHTMAAYRSSPLAIDATVRAYDFKSSRDERRPLLADIDGKRPVHSGPPTKTTPPQTQPEVQSSVPKRRPTSLQVGVCLLVAVVVTVVVILLAIFLPKSTTPAPAPPANASHATTVTLAPVPTPTSGSSGLTGSGAPTVEVSFLCNHVLTGADAGFCLAVFSYDNPSGSPVAVPIGANNYMQPGPLASSHPTTFVAGTRYGAVTSRWDCVGAATAYWVVRSGAGVSVAAAPRAHHECPPLPL